MMHQLFALEPNGLRQLSIPENLLVPAQVLDDIPAGIYEALRTFEHNRFVGLEAHLQRAQRSVERLGITQQLDFGALRQALHQISSGFPGEDSKLRFDVLPAPAAVLGTDSQVIFLAGQLVLPNPSVYEQGVSCRLLSTLSRPRPQVKESRWVVDRRPSEGGTAENFESILVSPGGELLEGVMSNFFIVRDGGLMTPPVEGGLPGVTRSLVLDLSRGRGIPTLEEHLPASGLGGLQEAFFSTSVRSIVPIIRVEGVQIGSGQPGPITRILMRDYRELCESKARTAL